MQITVHCGQKSSTNKSPDKWAITFSKLELPLTGHSILCKDGRNVQPTMENGQLSHVLLSVRFEKNVSFSPMTFCLLFINKIINLFAIIFAIRGNHVICLD